MLTTQRGDAACPELQAWAQEVSQRVDPAISVTVEYEADSHTYIVRLVKEPRVLIFRLSQSQVHGDGRDVECERTVHRKIKDLWNLI